MLFEHGQGLLRELLKVGVVTRALLLLVLLIATGSPVELSHRTAASADSGRSQLQPQLSNYEVVFDLQYRRGTGETVPSGDAIANVQVILNSRFG